MDQKVLDYVVEKTHELMNAPSCSKEAKQAAKNWLDAIGTDNQLAETKKDITELEADIMPIDGLLLLILKWVLKFLVKKWQKMY